MNRKTIRKIFNVALAILMLGISLFAGASDVSAFSLFGWLKKEPPATEVQETVQQEFHVQQQSELQQQNQFQETIAEEELVDAGEALRFANSDKWTTDFLKNFAGDRFCIETEERVAYADINDDGTISLLNEKPEKCAEISTTESYLRQAWEKVQNRERISYKEIKNNVDIPWTMKAKIAYVGAVMGVKESFS